MFGVEFDDTDGSVVLEVNCLYFSWLEKLAHNEKVTGSSPVGCTKTFFIYWLSDETGIHARLGDIF